MEITLKKPYRIYMDDGLTDDERLRDGIEMSFKDCVEGDKLKLVKGQRSKLNGEEIGKVHEGTIYEFAYYQMQSDDGKICKFES